VERRISLPVPLEEAWGAIIDFSAWFCDEHRLDEVAPGGRIEFRWANGVSCRATFEEVDRPHSFSFRFAPFERHGGLSAVPRPQTRVEITLEPNENGVDVVVVEMRLDVVAEAIA